MFYFLNFLFCFPVLVVLTAAYSSDEAVDPSRNHKPIVNARNSTGAYRYRVRDGAGPRAHVDAEIALEAPSHRTVPLINAAATVWGGR